MIDSGRAFSRRRRVRALLFALLMGALFATTAAPVAAAPGHEQWRPGWGLPGANGQVDAVVEFGTDTIIGGDFETAGDVVARRVARWDGTSWHAMGDGFDDRVFALAVWNGSLYAGGEFTASGTGAPLQRIARWDGTAWVDVGGGTDGTVEALTVFQGELVAGGSFFQAGGVFTDGIATFDGTNWAGTNAFAEALALTVYAGELIATGLFDSIGSTGTPVNRIARYDGTTWRALGSGLTQFEEGENLAEGLDLIVHGSDLVVGGFFTHAGGTAVDGIASWNGSTWSAVGSNTPFDNEVYAVASFGGSLYASGGALTTVWELSGPFWSSGIGFGSNFANVLAVAGGRLVAGGSIGFIQTPDASGATNVARFDGTTWTAFSASGGAGDDVLAFTEWNGQLIAGGRFRRIGLATASAIGAWDGTQWSALGSGITGFFSFSVDALTSWNGDLIAGGSFSTAGGNPAQHVARWDGTQWNAMGAGSLSGVRGLATLGSDLYATGSFGGNVLGRWDGSAWNGLGGGVSGGVALVNDLVAYQGDLVIGGSFTSVGGVSAPYVALWNGTAWVSLGTGLNGTVDDLAAAGSDLYAVGTFSDAGGVAVSNIAKWDGTSWSALSGGLDIRASAVHVLGGDVYATGQFQNADGQPASFVARWDGTAWNAMGSGLDARGRALGDYAGSLFVGGDFAIAGLGAGSRIAEWDPVPEPGFASALAAGVGALAYGARRRRGARREPA
ncbi:MAG: hypothetical protein AAGC67_12350 [Myxococcota bacterium]